MNVDPQSAVWRALKKEFLERIERHRSTLEHKDDDKARGAIRELRSIITDVEPEREVIPEILGPEY